MCSVIVVGFFCKQKTAYEMRISDWSSDVCSSDLLDIGAGRMKRPCRCLHVSHDGARLDRERRAEQEQPGHRRNLDDPDRKSVVSGQSVSVRVDLGGRRIIKKKHTCITYTSTTSHNSTSEPILAIFTANSPTYQS